MFMTVNFYYLLIGHIDGWLEGSVCFKRYTAWRCFRVAFVLALVSFLCYCIQQRHLLSIKFSWIMAYFRKTKVEFHDWPNFMKKIMTCIHLAKILNNLIPHPLKSNFRKEGRSFICPSVIIRSTIDYSKMADICLAAVWSRDKFPAKINKLTRDLIDLWTTMATVGSTCLQQVTINLSEQNQIVFAHNGQSDIDEGK